MPSRTKDDKKMYFEAKEEHHVVKLVLPEVKEGGMAVEEFAAKCKVLKELVEHHADEEEKEMFPEARKALSRAELQELGDRMARARRNWARKTVAAKPRKNRSPVQPGVTDVLICEPVLTAIESFFAR